MNTSALKSFAPAVRRQLMEAVTRKLDFALSAKTPSYLTTYAPQVAALRKRVELDRHGLIERVAYTWFNRFAALRFMDARGWHPFRARVLTAADATETQPELLKVTRNGAFPEELQPYTDIARLNELLDGVIPSTDAQGEVYRELVLAACRYYHALLPDLFEKLDDETELLLPDDLLTEHSVAHGFRTEISEDDCSEVELLGWLYQFYISEKKDAVMARKSAVPTEDIPAVTQLFTPHWIVRYLVENSLGRLWLLNRPGSRLREHMPYYIEGEAETDFLKISKPEEIKLVDPAVGSGHMLTYAFDLLTLIYEEEGYAPTEIPALILRHNLHGLEICPRAAQLAELALVFKAREKSRRFFQPEHLVRPRIIELRDVRFEENELRDYIAALELGDLFNKPILQLLHQFEEAKNFGSLIQPCVDGQSITFAKKAIEFKDLGGQLFLRETHLKVLRVLEQAEALIQRYHVVVANPPYMGGANMIGRLKVFAGESYPTTKSDLFSMFVERSLNLVSEKGYTSLVTMQNWMFLSSFTRMREELVLPQRMINCIQIGYNSFPELNSKVAQAAAFTICKAPHSDIPGRYYDLNSAPQSADKNAVFIQQLQADEYYTATSSQLRQVPGSPLAYWVSEKLRQAFTKHPSLKSACDTRQGMATSDNGRFLRLWFEIPRDRFSLNCDTRATAKIRDAKWVPYNKGGEFRRWWGNQEYALNWKNDGQEVIAYAAELYGSPTRTIKSLSEYFKPCSSWSKISSGSVAFRYFPPGFVFDVAGCSIFYQQPSELALNLGFLNSRVASALLAATSPTLNFEAGHIAALPYLRISGETAIRTNDVVERLIQISRADWDNLETSWNFRDQPLLRNYEVGIMNDEGEAEGGSDFIPHPSSFTIKAATLAESWSNYAAYCTAAIRGMQELETENNRLFIAAYGLDGELQPEVPEAQITLARAEARRDMAAFLSYAVGCMMGRYSLDHPGLILANAGESLSDFLAKVGKPLEELTFVPDEDGIIPVLDGEWFEDDIVARTRDFLRATFGEATLRENLRFIEDSLGKELRSYFLTDFYRDHLQTYKKRPIYWMVQSPKKGFSALIYLHRYSRDTMNLVLNRYLRDYQVKLRNRLAHVSELQTTAPTAKEKTEARKETDKLTKILHESEEWERQTLLPLAQARIELDLDDGVKVNYLKLGEALATIPGLASKED